MRRSIVSGAPARTQSFGGRCQGTCPMCGVLAERTVGIAKIPFGCGLGPCETAPSKSSARPDADGLRRAGLVWVPAVVVVLRCRGTGSAARPLMIAVAARRGAELVRAAPSRARNSAATPTATSVLSPMPAIRRKPTPRGAPPAASLRQSLQRAEDGSLRDPKLHAECAFTRRRPPEARRASVWIVKRARVTSPDPLPLPPRQREPKHSAQDRGRCGARYGPRI
jgi:hypothetical protein